MSHPSRSRSEVELASLHLAFSALSAGDSTSARASAHARPTTPASSSAYISDEDLDFEPLEESVVEFEESAFALKAQLALAAMSTPPASSVRSSSSAHSTPGLSYSPFTPERSGMATSRDGYFSRSVHAGEDSCSAMSPYGARSSSGLSSGHSSPSLWHSTGSPSSGPVTPPVYHHSPSYEPQPITALSLAQLNKASIKARGLRLPPRQATASHACGPTPCHSSASDAAPKTPQKTIKGFQLDLGVLSSNFEGISLAGASGRRSAAALLDDIEAPSSPAFRTKPRMTKYAF